MNLLCRLREKLPRPSKRLSDVTTLSKSSSGGSSGYLGSCSSTSDSAKRSRLSMDPRAPVEKHNTPSKLPSNLIHSTLHPTLVRESPDGTHSPESRSSQDSVQPQVGSPARSKQGAERVVKVEDGKDVVLETILEEAESGSARRKAGKRARGGSGSSDSGHSSRKRLIKKRNIRESIEETEDEEQQELEQEKEKVLKLVKEPEVRSLVESLVTPCELCAGDRVFARWTDPAGVYFYAAEVLEVISPTEAKVRFLEDKIVRTLKVESEMINVKALHPHDEITVKHDVLDVYDVTAKLMAFPTRNAAGEVEYEVAITATDSEPQYNEDSRTVHYSEVSLTDNQASLIIRRMGFVPASNKVSADINFGNLIFGKRKPRTVNSSPGTTPSKAGGDSTPSGVTPKKTPRRRRGGPNVEESAATESSAPETTPRSKKSLKTLISTTEDECDNESLSKRSRKAGTAILSKTVDPNLFKEHPAK